MKYALLLALVAILLVSSALAQTRDLGAKRIMLDNGLGTGTLTLEYNGVGNQSLDANSLTPLPSGTESQTLRHNGTGWEATSVLQTTATGVKTNGAVYKSTVFLPDPFFYSISNTDHVVLIETSGVAIIDLPLPLEAGREITIRMIGNPVFANVSSFIGLVDGQLEYDLSGLDKFVTFVCDGTNWWSTSRN